MPPSRVQPRNAPAQDRARDISDDVTEPYARPLAPPAPRRRRISSSFDAHHTAPTERRRALPPPDLQEEVTQTLTDVRSLVSAARDYAAHLHKERMSLGAQAPAKTRSGVGPSPAATTKANGNE